MTRPSTVISREMLTVRTASRLSSPQRLTEKQRASLRLQGPYVATMRGLIPSDRAKDKKIRSAKRIMAALKAAETRKKTSRSRERVGPGRASAGPVDPIPA